MHLASAAADVCTRVPDVKTRCQLAASSLHTGLLPLASTRYDLHTNCTILFNAHPSDTAVCTQGRSGVTRLNSTVPQTGRSSLRVLVYGLGAGSLVVGGSLAYANYDPAFRNQVSDYVPAFGTASDYVADKWVELVDAVRPQSSSGNVGLGRKEVSTGVVTPPRPSSGTSMQKENPVKGKESVASTQEQPKPKARVIKIEPQQQDTAAPSPPKTTPPPPPPPLVAPADAVSTTPPPEQGSPKDKGKVEVQEAALKEPVEDKQAKEEAVLKEPGALVEETKASEPLTDASRAEISPQEASGIIQAAKVKLEVSFLVFRHECTRYYCCCWFVVV